MTTLLEDYPSDVSPDEFYGNEPIIDGANLLDGLTAQLRDASWELRNLGAVQDGRQPDSAFGSDLMFCEDHNYTAKQLGEFVRAGDEWLEEVDAHYPDDENTAYQAQESKILELLSLTDSDTLQAVYADLDNGGSELHLMLEDAISNDNIGPAATLLRSIYGCRETIELMDQADDPVAHQLLMHEATVDAMTDKLAEEFKQAEHAPDHERSALDAKANRYLHSFINYYLGDLPETMKEDIELTAWPRALEQKSQHIDYKHFVAHLEPALTMIQDTGIELGSETIAKLRKKAGIVNLDYRSFEQLELLSKLVDGDRETIERLQTGDVTVVFVDEMGDYNGAFRWLHEIYATKNNRTLVLGLTKPGDLYRHMLMLRDLGIKPSTVALGVHGNLGELVGGRKGGQFTISNDELSPDTRPEDVPGDELFIPMARAIPRIVEEFMRDSRGIDEDDNPDATGRRRIILNVCHQAVPRAVNRYLKAADGAVQTTTVKESMATTLTKAARSSNLDVFASREAILTLDKDDGRTMQFKVRLPDETLRDSSVVRHFLDEDGNVIVQEQAELVLRRESNKPNEDSSSSQLP